MLRKATLWSVAALLGVAIVDFLFAPIFSMAIVAVFGDAMDWKSRSLAGRNAIDCGRVSTQHNPKTATECVLSAVNNKRAFRVRYDLLGFDSAVAAGLVGDSRGNVYGLTFDGNPSGSGGTSLFSQHVGIFPCPTPLHVYTNPRGRANCFPQKEAPRNIMEPNFEPH
jgi:hypothetical protein